MNIGKNKVRELRGQIEGYTEVEGRDIEFERFLRWRGVRCRRTSFWDQLRMVS